MYLFLFFQKNSTCCRKKKTPENSIFSVSRDQTAADVTNYALITRKQLKKKMHRAREKKTVCFHWKFILLMFEGRLKDSPYESKTAAFACEPIAWYINIADFAATLESAAQVLRRGAVRQIVHLEGDHPVDAGRRSSVTHPGLDFRPFSLSAASHEKTRCVESKEKWRLRPRPRSLMLTRARFFYLPEWGRRLRESELPPLSKWRNVQIHKT